MRARLGGAIELVGYTPDSPPPGPDALAVRLHWRATGPVDGDYTAFVQLLDGHNQLVTSWDAQPLAGLDITSRWQPGEMVVDRFTLPLPEALPPGDYWLVTGMYSQASGRRLLSAADAWRNSMRLSVKSRATAVLVSPFRVM